MSLRHLTPGNNSLIQYLLSQEVPPQDVIGLAEHHLDEVFDFLDQYVPAAGGYNESQKLKRYIRLARSDGS